eukprot:GGOE01041194.1.p1 GENE.GGOE01041194.1~~GGOE01041194.1.p1  ORF type:complete len:534 (-),score=117.13 GGOE01041194.1:312-1751(-)
MGYMGPPMPPGAAIPPPSALNRPGPPNMGPYGSAPGGGGDYVPYTGPPDPASLRYQDPHTANTGPPLHGYDSVAPEGRTVYISNVPNGITEFQLQDFFSIVGTAMKVKLCGEEYQPTRFAFIEFASVEECHRSISITGVMLCGRPLKISQSKGAIQASTGGFGGSPLPVSNRSPEEQERMSRTVYVSNLPTSIPEVQIVEFIGLSGKVINYKFCGEETQETRYAFFEFENLVGAAACKAITGTQLGGYTIKCADSKGIIHTPPEQAVALALQTAQSAPATASQNPLAEVISRTIYIGNIDPAVSEAEMRTWFEERCGPAVKTNMLEGTSGGYRYGFVEFVDRQSAVNALQYNGHQLGAGIIKVAPSKGAIQKAANANVTQPAITNPNSANIMALNNQAYAMALQEENRKYQEYLAKKAMGEETGRRRRRRSRSRSGSPKRKRSRSGSRSRGRRDRERDRDESRDRRGGPPRIRERDRGR